MVSSLTRYDTRLVEEAVLLKVRVSPVEEQVRFRARRDSLYDHPDPDEREAAFEALHGEWFVCLALDGPLHRALSEWPSVLGGVSECRVMPARSRRDEMADLLARKGTRPVLIVRLRPESLLRGERVLAFLRGEILHVADMLAPAFGYERELPASEEGPSYDNILRNRYRAVWDATVSGRLFSRGLCEASVREARRREFTMAFGVLGAGVDEAFALWFEDPHPTHSRIVAFIQDPRSAQDGERPSLRAGCCPVCRFPAALDSRPERLSAAAVREIQSDRPTWRPDHGLCPQCVDLYIARVDEHAETKPRTARTRPSPQTGASARSSG